MSQKQWRSDTGFAANCIGVMLSILKERYSDEQIIHMLKPENVSEMLGILEKEQAK